MAPALTTEIELSTIDFPLLGWHIMYLINQVEIPYQAFQKLLDQHGFTGYQIEPVGETVALQRAVTRWVDDRAKHGKGPRRTRWVMDPDTEIRQQALIRSVAVPKASPFLVFALVTESSDATLADLNYDTDLRIVLDKTTGQLVCSRAAGSLILETPTPLKRPRGRPRKDETQASLAANRKVARDILEGSAHGPGSGLHERTSPILDPERDMLRTDECSRIIRDILAGLNSVATRQRGGVYFVPYDQLRAVQQLHALIAALPTPTLPADSPHRPYLYASGVVDRPQAKRSLAVALHAGIMDEVAHAAQRLKVCMERPHGTVQADTMFQRLAEFRRVREKATAYAESGWNPVPPCA